LNGLERRKARSRARLLLNDAEYARLRSAVHKTHTNKSFIILEAIQRGLHHGPQLDNIPTARTRRVDFWIPTEIDERVRELAKTHSLTQQSILRYFLFTDLKLQPTRPLTAAIPATEESL
jgi:hypothetical protein